MSWSWVGAGLALAGELDTVDLLATMVAEDAKLSNAIVQEDGEPLPRAVSVGDELHGM